MSNIPETELIEYVKKQLKEKGFKKKNKRWMKVVEDFTISFLIQGSCYDKDSYYIRPGVFINALETDLYYGHFMTELAQDSLENIFCEFEKFVAIWTDKVAIKKIIADFIEWDKRNPLEKRRAGLVDYEKDPVPSKVCFGIPAHVIEYILVHF